MSIDRSNFDALTEADLAELVLGQVPEGLRLEYKLQTYGTADSDKAEFLKDISALANTQGGHLLIGVQETGGVATGIPGLPGIDVDTEIVRLVQIARSGLEPKVNGIQLRPVPLVVGASAIVIRVPPSWAAPHRVSAGKRNRFYIRHPGTIDEPSVEELRMMFTQSALSLDRAREFRGERLLRIEQGRGSTTLAGGPGRVVLHIVPVSAMRGAAFSVDLQRTQASALKFRPLSGQGFSPSFNYDGFVIKDGSDGKDGYTQIFRSGIVEAVRGALAQDDDRIGRSIPGTIIESEIIAALPPYISAMRDIGVSPPLIVMVSLQGVDGAKYLAGYARFGTFGAPLPSGTLTLPEGLLEDFGDEIDHHKAVRPAFDALWNARGAERCANYNDEGRWVRPQ